jgi:hypothetical protein
MSQAMLKVPVSELDTMRLVCLDSGCGATVEVSAAALLKRKPTLANCPVCNGDLLDRAAPGNPLLALAKALRDVADLQGQKRVAVEFLIPAKP